MGDVKTPLLTRISKELATLMDGNANRADVVLPFLHQLIAELPSSPTPSLPEDVARVVGRLRTMNPDDGDEILLGTAAALIRSLSSQLAEAKAKAANLRTASIASGNALSEARAELIEARIAQNRCDTPDKALSATIYDLRHDRDRLAAEVSEFMTRLGPRWFLDQGWFPASQQEENRAALDTAKGAEK